MIKAANVILTLHNQIEQSNNALLNQQRQLEELAQAYETLRNSITPAAPS
jgi:type II secretory pathway component PulJ